jgi:radical SAM protein with 4Fe4S-binding SPASM domain
VSWSLNTSTVPRGEVRRALERHPPAFVAVSVDGPAVIHDRFRGRLGALAESLAAIDFFAALGSVVAAGTTVTRRNFGALPQTLALVARTRAAHWGLHLLVPEGRARSRPDLFLRRGELRRLLRFVADKRRYFPVMLADEFGYCGDWEPLVRDAPWRCGAGRMQCVVLPGGDVVPCTTADRETSAGNLRHRELREIWDEGFAELRADEPHGACRSCGHFSACGGGCWLLRRHGRSCLRDVWSTPQSRAWPRAAGVLLALGLSAGPARAQDAGTPETSSADAGTTDAAPAPEGSVESETGAGIEAAIVLWQTREMPDSEHRSMWGRDEVDGDGPLLDVPADRADDAGWQFYKAVLRGTVPHGLSRCARAVRDALGTQEKSLALAALLFRTLAECTLDGRPAARRLDGDRTALRDTLAALRLATERWRQETYAGRLEPYLARGREHRRYGFEMCKALIPPPNWLRMTRDMAEERWGEEASVDREAAEQWLTAHPYAEGLALHVESTNCALELAEGEAIAANGAGTIGIYDVVVVPSGDTAVVVSLRGTGEEAYDVTLPAGSELTWADLVRLAYEQNRDVLDERAAPIVEEEWRDDSEATDPLLLPALRARKREQGARVWLADFWMF